MGDETATGGGGVEALREPIQQMVKAWQSLPPCDPQSNADNQFWSAYLQVAAVLERPALPPEDREDLESATAQLLIELSFLAPRGTDLRTHPISDKLKAFARATRLDALAASRPAPEPAQREVFIPHGELCSAECSKPARGIVTTPKGDRYVCAFHYQHWDGPKLRAASVVAEPAPREETLDGKV